MHSLRRSAVLVAAAALLPLLLFLVFEIGFSARDQRRMIETRALSTTDTMMAIADGEVKRHVAALDALATAQSLTEGNRAQFIFRAAEIARMNRDWVDVQLVDGSGRIVAETDPAGRSIDRLPGSVTPSARFAGFVRGPGCPCILLERTGKDVAHDVVRLLVSVRTLEGLLPPVRGKYEVSAIVDGNGRFITRNLSLQKYFGHPASRFVRTAVASGKRDGVYRGTTLEGFENYSAFTRSALTGWSAHIALGSEYIDNPARRFIASLGMATLLSLALAAILVLFVLRQLAQGREVAARLEQSQKLEALGQLTGGIAHDFNNLLTPIVGVLDFLTKKPELDERSKRMAEGALSSARRAGKLTGQLLAFSRRQRRLIQPVDLTAMIEDMRDMFDQSVGATHEIRLSVAEVSLCARSDLNQLELAILNLVLNARDASPEGSPIEVSLAKEPGGIIAIRVGDRGEGMSEAVRRRAVEPFFTTKVEGSGTGLGLAQVFGVVHQSGGSLHIDSSPGAGTTVTIRLQECEPPADSFTPAIIPGASSKRALRLLVVDDDPHVREALERPLKDAGHDVESVADGATALTAVESRPFDLVLVDYQMPRMNGAEFIARARGVRPALKFLLVTGFADSTQLAAAAPDTPILSKPFSGAELIGKVAAVAGA